MALLTSLARVQAIASTDTFIQGLIVSDAVVNQVLTYVTSHVQADPWDVHQQEAQDYLAAHMMSMAGQPNGGRGPLSSRSVGRVSTSFTLPYLNRKEALGATQYGTHFLDLQSQVVAAIRVIFPAN